MHAYSLTILLPDTYNYMVISEIVLPLLAYLLDVLRIQWLAPTDPMYSSDQMARAIKS